MYYDSSRKGSTVFALLGVFCFVALALTPEPLAEAVTEEAGVIETIGALGFLLAMVLAAVIAWRSTGVVRVYFMVWAALTAIFFGEETSWLQHYLDFDTPLAYRELNAQGELNIHNLVPLQGGSLVEGEVSIGTFFKSQNLFRLGFLVYFGVLPILALMRTRVGGLIRRAKIPVIGPRDLISSWSVIVVSFLLVVMGAFDSPLAEAREAFYGLVILRFVAAHFRRPGEE